MSMITIKQANLEQNVLRRGTNEIFRWAGSLCALFLIAIVTSKTTAQSSSDISIERIYAGLPAGPSSGNTDLEVGGYFNIYREGRWAPVWVDLNVRKVISEPLELIVKCLDSSNGTATTKVIIPPTVLQKTGRKSGYDLGPIAYIKPMSNTEVEVSVRTVTDQRELANREKHILGFSINHFAYVGIGDSWPGFRLPVIAEDQEKDQYKNHRGGEVQLAQCLEVGQLPDEAIGYDGFDMIVVFTAGNDKFWNDFVQPQHQKKRDAIINWVKQGGRIILTAGINSDLLNSIPEFRSILPVTISAENKKTLSSLQISWQGLDRVSRSYLLGNANKQNNNETIIVSGIAPARGTSYQILSPPPEWRQSKEIPPLVVQGSFSLGKVTLVNFDINREPFISWDSKQRSEFWEWLVVQGNTNFGRTIAFTPSVSDTHSKTQLLSMLESFEGIAVIKFSWVAIFLIFYVLLIGPFDYFFLKKVVKRLEWTWITFPVIVISVSAISYIAAYKYKGTELRLNKIDVVDIDTQNSQVFGHTWFTIFSPRIQNYTVGLEPAGPAKGDKGNEKYWVSETAAESMHHLYMSDFGSASNSRNQQLGRRGYNYYMDKNNPDQPDFAAGLENVPIQVWSTKTFAATWSSKTDPKKPLVAHTLHHPKDQPEVIIGSITSHLPVKVESGAFLLYRDRTIPLDTLLPDQERQIVSKPDNPLIPTALAQNNFRILEQNRISRASEIGPNTVDLWSALFADQLVYNQGIKGNDWARELDQSWRITKNHNNEAILVFRTPTIRGSIDNLNQDPANPTRIWFDNLPSEPGQDRVPSKIGSLRQTTLVRIFLQIPPLPIAKDKTTR